MIWHRTATFQFLSWLWGDSPARIWEWVPKLTVTLSTYYSLSTSVRGQGPWSLLVACAYISCPHILTFACCSPPRDVQQHKMHIYDYFARAGVQFKDSSGTWRRNGDRLFTKLCLVVVLEILKERTLITPKFNIPDGGEWRILLQLCRMACMHNAQLQNGGGAKMISNLTNVFVQIKNCKMYLSKFRIAKCTKCICVLV